ncbi:MAG: hypothetical protein COX90_00190 [Candidatus Nealsonbacteria bacterium CG_4_10_14_0_2_um_filter_38_17]|uniref:Glycosyltransferase family 1 protein n=2 Tax=Candidatus Nealsoniibacteriota TaxID=1817911 RepID=A0A2M7UZ92_9BACT|nr:MAG: hypothetical protein COX36_00520 [Candidatus Nealsonbacteria bacterium CG23_combo_of_CG06-09_8_20_14_all_38_19]PIZ89279.1 MAG: hypothetical protein COX90_00190 [Candidatus Nealsonbacteria bacterium CG_4_10_14_0_2_um_filter_38_17]
MTRKKLKIALISAHSFLRPGGVKSHVLGLYREFKRRGLKTKIIVPRRSSKEYYGKDIILLGTSFPLPFAGSESDFCINLNPLKINKVLKKEKFDILHFHNFGVPSALQILDRSQSLNILTFHGDLEGSKFFKRLPSLLRLFKGMAKGKIDGLIGVAPLVLEFFEDFYGLKTIIPNGIDIKEFNSKNPKIEKFNDAKINILFIGRIEKRKGLLYLLKAYKILIKKFSNLRLIVVGKGDLEKECKEWANENKLTEVYFEGEKSGKELPSYYATCDIFVSPAIFGESFGIVLLEAMASGKPFVGFANRGYSQLMKRKPGEKFLAEPKDYKELASKIEILIKDENLRKKMGEWGREEAEKYSWPKIADQVLAFYEVCLRNKKRHKKQSLFDIDKIKKRVYNKLLLRKHLYKYKKRGQEKI